MKTYIVTKKQLIHLSNKYCGIIAYREEDGKCFVRIWWPGYTKEIENYINQ